MNNNNNNNTYVADAFSALLFIKRHIYQRIVEYIKIILLFQIIIWSKFIELFTRPIVEIVKNLFHKNMNKMANPNIDLWKFILVYMQIELLFAIPLSVLWLPLLFISKIYVFLTIYVLLQLVVLSFWSINILNIYGKEDLKINDFTNDIRVKMGFGEKYLQLEKNLVIDKDNILDVGFLYLLTFGYHIYHPIITRLFSIKNIELILMFFENYDIVCLKFVNSLFIQNRQILNQQNEFIKNKLTNEKNKFRFMGQFEKYKEVELIPPTPKVKFPSIKSLNENSNAFPEPLYASMQ